MDSKTGDGTQTAFIGQGSTDRDVSTACRRRPADRLFRGATTWVSLIVIAAVGVALIWPVSAGVMPRSADHPVHLTRIHLWAEILAQGHLRGWSPVWAFGVPVGELYPVLGDALVIALRWSSLGRMSWPAAYAWGFTAVFLLHGVVGFIVARRMGAGDGPATIVALLLLLDVGAYREGGWIYTVDYGVWPQTLATSLSWWALAEFTALVSMAADEPWGRRWAAVAGLVALALLAHPMALMTLMIGGGAIVIVLAVDAGSAWRRPVGMAIGILSIGGLAAAWWWGPMLEHRAWMASYGWLGPTASAMWSGVLQGRWFQSQPVFVGWMLATGLVLIAGRGTAFARSLALAGLLMWLAACRDGVWALRLDQLSEGFTHLQYQRFWIAAKPGLMACIAVPIGMIGQGLQRWLERQGATRFAGYGRWCVILGVGGGLLGVQVQTWRLDPDRRPVQVHRFDGLDDDVQAWIDWTRRTWERRDAWYRTSVRDHRDLHWFMDAPVFTGVPLFKTGFTPGDNFVHKPESASPAVLDRARVRYVMTRGTPRRASVVTLGRLSVVERPTAMTSVAWIEGMGDADVILEDPGREIRVRVRGSEPGSRLVFGVAGFPRWELTGPRGAMDWVEVPVVGSAAAVTLDERRSGALRGGKAWGDDGTEPTLIAASVTDGEYVLRYRSARFRDRLWLVVSGVAWMVLGSVAWGMTRAWSIEARPSTRWMARIGLHPVVLVIALALLGGRWGYRHAVAERRERSHAIGWSDAQWLGARPGYLKTEMLIRPAIVVSGVRAEATFHRVQLPHRLSVWWAIEDDDAKRRARGTRTIAIEVRHAEEWVPLLRRAVAHRPGRVELALPTEAWADRVTDVRVSVKGTGMPPRLGFDLALMQER